MTFVTVRLLVAILISNILYTASINSLYMEPLPACDSEIFCFGELLDAAQRAHIHNDSKSFVDMKLNEQPEIVIRKFKELSPQGNLSDAQVKQFVEENFSAPGSEFVEWNPNDWKENPTFLSRIVDPQLRSWAADLNRFWKELGRAIIDDVRINSSLYSLIPVANPVVVPGGRFREFYYWDTYWVMRGLILSEMHDTVKGMLKNFLALVEKIGLVPNGGRIYYKRRSQPPFLIPMVDAYIAATDDTEFLHNSLPTLEKEYNFWMRNRTVKVDKYRLNVYSSTVNQPRPESYREDKEDISDLTEGPSPQRMGHFHVEKDLLVMRAFPPPYEEGMELMQHLTSACESGWDFSSRWAGNEFNSSVKVTKQLKTRDIIPVDLNSILAWNERILADFHRRLGNESEAATYDETNAVRVEAMETLLWNEEDGAYYDYEISSKTQNKKYFASNLNPLWTKCFPASVNRNAREDRLYQYLQNKGVLNYPGGIPTSLEKTGEQWDFPNAWPPLVHMIIEGLDTSVSEMLQDEAFTQAQKWIRGNYKAYVKTEAMFEKYDVTATDGVPGSGGEYDVQVGFGWTNGVIMTFLDRYADKTTVNETATTTTTGEMTTSAAMTSLSTINILCFLVFLLFCIFVI